MTRFREKLSAILPEDGRPFVCDGSPYDCKIFVVGHNPATKIGFWPYWDDCTGFDKDTWFEDYKNERRRQGEPPVSRTRCRLDKLTELLAPVKVLETNVYPKASKKANQLQAEDRVTKVLDFLVQEIEPELIITHGKPAAKHFCCKMMGFDKLEIVTCSTKYKPCKFISVYHATNRTKHQWTDSNLEELGHVVCQAVNMG